MNIENKDILLALLRQYEELGVSQQIDYDKFYLYSIITHSTAIEGSTVTEVEAQLLFDEGITSSKRTMMEQMMNLDLKVAYEHGMKWIKNHAPITTEWLIIKSDIDQYVKSTSEKMVDKSALAKEMADKWSIKPSLAEKLVDILAFMADKQEVATDDVISKFGFTATTTKRYMRQLTEFGYLEAYGGNKNRRYSIIKKSPC